MRSTLFKYTLRKYTALNVHAHEVRAWSHLLVPFSSNPDSGRAESSSQVDERRGANSQRFIAIFSLTNQTYSHIEIHSQLYEECWSERRQCKPVTNPTHLMGFRNHSKLPHEDNTYKIIWSDKHQRQFKSVLRRLTGHESTASCAAAVPCHLHMGCLPPEWLKSQRLHRARRTPVTSHRNAFRTLSLTHTFWSVTNDKRWRLKATRTYITKYLSMIRRQY